MNTATGCVYRVAGGAPIAVSAWSVFGGVQPYVTVDQWCLDNMGDSHAHLSPSPADGTLVEGLPSQTYWSFRGGRRSAAAAAAGAVQVDDAGLAVFPLADTTPPVTTVHGADSAWHSSPVTLTFTATDNEGGSGMSGGAAKTEYRLDDGAWTSGSSCVVPAPPEVRLEHTVLYRSTDAAGNTESARSCTVRIDMTTGPGPDPDPPSLSRLSAASGRRGATLTLMGSGFGDQRAGGSVSFGGVKSGSYAHWSDTVIVCKVPKKARLGKLTVRVVTDAGASGGRSFRVRK